LAGNKSISSKEAVAMKNNQLRGKEGTGSDKPMADYATKKNTSV
jgi:hypothetical protein